MQTKENSFISKFINSIKNFEKYPEMASKRFSEVFKYIIELIGIFTVIVTIISVCEVSKELKSGIEYFKNEIPNLKFSENKLEVDSEETIRIENNNNILDLIIINTNDITEEEFESYKKDIEKYSTGAIFLKDKLVVNIGSGTVEYLYENLTNIYHIGNMDKQTILNYFSGINLIMLYVGIFIISYIYLFMAYITSILFDSLILGTIGYITALVLRLRIRFIAMIKIAIHSLTLPIILNLLYIIMQTIFNFEIKYFEVMYITISYIYIITAILMIKSDLIKRGQDLAKIIEEEKRIKEQLEREKEEQEQEQDQEEEKEKKNEKKEKKKSNKEDNLGAEPQGENA